MSNKREVFGELLVVLVVFFFVYELINRKQKLFHEVWFLKRVWLCNSEKKRVFD